METGGKTPMGPVVEPPGVGRLAGQIAVGLLIWVGVNTAVFLGVSLLAFWAFSSLSIRQETAFMYSLVCAVPAALVVSSIVAGRRVLRMLKD